MTMAAICENMQEDQSVPAQQLASVEIVIDKMHFTVTLISGI